MHEQDATTKRLKHVLTRMGFLCEHIAAKLIILVHIGNKAMIADIGTKVLAATDYHEHRRWLVYKG